jgi:hypothetical protein
LSIPDSIKKRLKGVITEPFRISGNISKQAPDFTFTPMEDDQADAQEKDPTILQILQGGDVIFAPAYTASDYWEEHRMDGHSPYLGVEFFPNQQHYGIATPSHSSRNAP